MPRRVFNAPKFNGGMILNADPSDLPEGFGVAAFDTMASLDSGSIGGRYADGDATGITDVEDYTYITRDGVTPSTNGTPFDMMYVSGNGFTMRANNFTVPSPLVTKCVTGHRDYALFGQGKDNPAYFYGYTNGSLNLVGTPNFMDPSRFTVLGKLADNQTAIPHIPFETGATYYYAFSVVYDGYQHGPLTEFFHRPVVDKDPISGLNRTMSELVVLVKHNLDTAAAQRISAVNIYRATVSAGLTVNERSEYLKVHEFKETDLAQMFGTHTSGSQTYDNWAEWHDGNSVQTGSSYENNSGLDETLTFCNLGYDIAHEMNNFLFVGNVGWKVNGVQKIPEGTRMLYRSMRGKYCQFKIIEDYLPLPFIPLALTSFNNRLIVFGSAEFAIVNPETMILEQVISGYGIKSKLCILTTLQGVFFANQNNMYVFDGQQVVPIGDPLMRCPDMTMRGVISDIGIMPYEDLVSGNGAYVGIQRVVYAPMVNSVMFIYSLNEPGKIYAYVFSLTNKTWSVSSFNSGFPKSAYTDRNNVLFVGGVPVMSSKEKITNWKYVTKRFDLGFESQWKKIYSINLNATNHNRIFAAAFDYQMFEGQYRPEVPVEYRRAHTVAIFFAPNEMYATYLNGIEITFREMLNLK